MLRRFKYDKWCRLLGAKIPNGIDVKVVKFMPKRRVLVLYQGELINTMLWCVPKQVQVVIQRTE